MKKKAQQIFTCIALLLYVAANLLLFPKPTLTSAVTFDISEGPTNDTFDAVNPLALQQDEIAFVDGEEDRQNQFRTPLGLIQRTLTFAFPLAGLILFAMIIWGGFETLSSAAGKKSVEAGRQRITAAIFGFLMLFSSYWIIQIIQTIFGITVLN